MYLNLKIESYYIKIMKNEKIDKKPCSMKG